LRSTCRRARGDDAVPMFVTVTHNASPSLTTSVIVRSGAPTDAARTAVAATTVGAAATTTVVRRGAAATTAAVPVAAATIAVVRAARRTRRPAWAGCAIRSATASAPSINPHRFIETSMPAEASCLNTATTARNDCTLASPRVTRAHIGRPRRRSSELQVQARRSMRRYTATPLRSTAYIACTASRRDELPRGLRGYASGNSARRLRLMNVSASASSTNFSPAGSHFKSRPSIKTMLQRWHEVIVR
jgi:hypothetical protein